MAAGRAGGARRLVLGVLGGVVGLSLVVGIVLVVQRPSLLSQALPGIDDCTASDGDTEVGLSTEQAEEAADVAAQSMRLELPRRTTRQAFVGELDLTDEDADVVARAFKGASAASLSCVHGGASEEDSDELDAAGLTPRAAAVRTAFVEAFGRQELGGFEPGGVSEGHMPGSAHYDGRAVDIFFRPITEANQERGWAMAHYLVAHAEQLGIETVIFDAQIWTARRAVQGWRAYEPDTSGREPEVAQVLEHRDHVHVDVAD